MKRLLMAAFMFSLVLLSPVTAQDSTLPELAVITAENAWAVELLLELESENCFIGNVSFSADGRFLATGGSRITQVWDIETGEVVFTSGDLCGDTTSTNPLFSPVEPLLAYEEEDRTTLLNFETGETEHVLVDGNTPLAFSADGTLMATLGDSISPCPYDAHYRPEYDSCYEVLIWEVASGELLGAVPGYASLRSFAAFSRDNRFLFYSYHHEVLVWSVETGELNTVLDTMSHGYSMYALTDMVVDRTGSTLYVAGSSIGNNAFTVEIGDNGEITRSRNVSTYRREPNRVGASPYSLEITVDGTALIVGDDRDGSLSFWNAHEHGRQDTGILLFYTQAHPSAVESLAMNRAGTLLASSDYRDRVIRLWGVRGGADARPTPTPTITPSPTVVPTLLPRGDASILPQLEPITVENVNQVQLLSVLPSSTGFTNGLAFNPDGTLLAVSGARHLTLWDMTTQTVYWEKSFDYNISELAFSPDGAFIAVGGGINDETVTLWDVATTHKRFELYNDEADHENKGVADIAFTPDGSKLILTYYVSGGVAVWDMSTGQVIEDYVRWHPNPDGGGIYVAAISEDGEFATSYEVFNGESALYIDDLNGPAWVIQLNEERWPDLFRDLAFTPDNQTLIMSGNAEGNGEVDRTVVWVDIESQAVIQTIHHTHRSLDEIALNVDGTLLALAELNANVVHLWDAIAGEELATLEGHTDRIWDLAFTQDGTLLASSSDDGTVRLWGLPGSETMASLPFAVTPTAIPIATLTPTP